MEHKKIIIDGNTFVISDHHFYHENIIKYCFRPFKTGKEMNHIMILKWNKVVSKNDTVLHLGDFSFGNKKMVSSIRKKLNGEIYMIKGNHDKHGVKWYSDCGITLIKKPFTENNILFSHARKEVGKNIINIHGHSHSHLNSEYPYLNVCVEQLNYTPIKIYDLFIKMNIHDHYIYIYEEQNRKYK